MNKIIVSGLLVLAAASSASWSGVAAAEAGESLALAWGMRLYSRAMGMRRTTKLVPGDRVALSALWFVFPPPMVLQ